MTDPFLQTPDGGIPPWMIGMAQLPTVPLLPPGADPMSNLIAGILPGLSAQLQGQMAALTGKETMFAGKLQAANTAYANADDSGSQSVGEIVKTLSDMGGQAGEMGGQGGGMGQMGSFTQLMQPLMQAMQGGAGGGQGGGADGGGAGAGGGADSAGQGLGGGAGGFGGGAPSAGQGSGGSSPASSSQNSGGFGDSQQQADSGGMNQDQREMLEPLQRTDDAFAQGNDPTDMHQRGTSAPIGPLTSPNQHGGGDLASKM